MIRPIIEQALREMRINVSEAEIQAFELFTAELNKWNNKINLTAITGDEEIAVKHIIDSLVFANCVREGECVLDIGSGAGFPAIPTKIVKPMSPVVSVDAAGKKIFFQKHVARLLGLQGFTALHVRAESLRETHPHCFDIITSRAFSGLEQFVGLAAPLLADAGRMVVMKGPAVSSEMKTAEDYLRKLGLEISDIYSYSLPLNRGERNLITITPRKTA